MVSKPLVTTKVVVLCGGVGAARLLTGLVQVVEPSALTAIVNVGDDLTLNGLKISPDIDTIIYTLADQVSPERGWGLKDETWNAMKALERYGGQTWFSLGDKDLATHLYRTQRVTDGASLSEVTSEISHAWDLPLTVLPATNEPVRTVVTTPEYGDLSFQEYFVGHQHNVPVTQVRFEGAEAAVPAPGALAALDAADLIVIAPSNPAVSIDPILAIPGFADLLRRRRDDVCAVSPLVGGQALKGPAARLMTELGGTASVVGIADWYQEFCSTLVFDQLDVTHTQAVSERGLRCLVTDTIMSDKTKAAELAAALLSLYED